MSSSVAGEETFSQWPLARDHLAGEGARRASRASGTWTRGGHRPTRATHGSQAIRYVRSAAGGQGHRTTTRPRAAPRSSLVLRARQPRRRAPGCRGQRPGGRAQGVGSWSRCGLARRPVAPATPSTTEATTKRWSGRAHRGAYADAQDESGRPAGRPRVRRCALPDSHEERIRRPRPGVRQAAARPPLRCLRHQRALHPSLWNTCHLRVGTNYTPHCKHATSPPEPVSLRPGRSRSKHQSHVIDVIGPPPPSGEYWMKRQHVGAVERGFRHRARFSRRTRFVGDKCPREWASPGVWAAKKNAVASWTARRMERVPKASACARCRGCAGRVVGLRLPIG